MPQSNLLYFVYVGRRVSVSGGIFSFVFDAHTRAHAERQHHKTMQMLCAEVCIMALHIIGNSTNVCEIPVNGYSI